MNRHDGARSGALFLLELIITILIFSLSAAVCINLFVQAHSLSERSKALGLAVNAAANAAETVRAAEDAEDAAKLLELVYGVPFGSDGGEVMLDSELMPADGENEQFLLIIIMKEEDGLLAADISVRQTGAEDELYHTNTLTRIPGLR